MCYTSLLNLNFNIKVLPDQRGPIYSFIKSNLMKEAANLPAPNHTPQPPTNPTGPFSDGVHKRGDKVVINGAKESLLAILKKYQCGCSKHTLEKLAHKFLTSNRITASYDLIVWVFIFIRKTADEETFSEILKEYLKKMRMKEAEPETHPSEEYVSKKKKTLRRFIHSAETLLDDELCLSSIESSIEALYSKGKSKESAFSKVESYLRKAGFEGTWDLQRSACYITKEPQSYFLEEPSNSLLNERPEDSPQEPLSGNPEEHISAACSQNETPRERAPLSEAIDYSNMSLRHSPFQVHSNDLFDELIWQSQQADSLHSQYYHF